MEEGEGLPLRSSLSGDKKEKKKKKTNSITRKKKKKTPSLKLKEARLRESSPTTPLSPTKESAAGSTISFELQPKDHDEEGGGASEERQVLKLKDQVARFEKQLLKAQRTIDKQAHTIIQLKRLLTDAGIPYEQILAEEGGGTLRRSKSKMEEGGENSDQEGKKGKRKSWRKSFGEYTSSKAPSSLSSAHARLLGLGGSSNTKRHSSPLTSMVLEMKNKDAIHTNGAGLSKSSPEGGGGGGEGAVEAPLVSSEPLRVVKKKGLTLGGILPRVADIPHDKQIRKWKDKAYDKCFNAASLVDWLLAEQVAEGKEEALMVGNLLLLSNVIIPLGNHMSFEGKKKELYALAGSEVEGDASANGVQEVSAEKGGEENGGAAPSNVGTPPQAKLRAKRSSSFLVGMRSRMEKDKKENKLKMSGPVKVRDIVLEPVREPFGSLEELMEQQQKAGVNDGAIPMVFEMLCKALLELNGCKTEGIFRISGHSEKVRELKGMLKRGEYDYNKILAYDVHEVASALKQLLGELSHPLIPEACYSRCIEAAKKYPSTANPLSHNNAMTVGVADKGEQELKGMEEKMMTKEAQTVEVKEEGTNMEELRKELLGMLETIPAVNKALIDHLLVLLRKLAEPENSNTTKMAVESLAVAFAPLFLRCPESSLLVQNATYEVSVVEALIRAPLLHKET